MKPWPLVLSILLLTGCATSNFKINDPQIRSAWNEHRKSLQHIDHWSLSGRFGASTETEAWSGSLSWNQQQDQYTIQLAGPLNQGAIQLSGYTDFAQLELENGIFVDQNAESLLYSHTGMQLPVSGLRYWILGLPSPGRKHQNVSVNEHGQIQSMREGHWLIEFKRYKNHGSVILPGKIFLKHDHVSVRLVLDKWKIDG